MAAAAILSSLMTTVALADITIGVTVSSTGPGAALGIPLKNSVELWPTEIDGEKLNVIVLDDAGDPSVATTNARRFANDDKADVIIGSALTPASIAVSSVAAEASVTASFLCAGAAEGGREPVDVRDAAGRGAHRAHAVCQDAGGWRQECRLHRLCGLLRRPVGRPVRDHRQGVRSNAGGAGALCASRHLGVRPGAEARRGSAGRCLRRRFRHRRRTSPARIARARLRRPDLPDARRGDLRLPCASPAPRPTIRSSLPVR